MYTIYCYYDADIFIVSSTLGGLVLISKYSVKRPYTVLVGVILVIVLGVVALTSMTADLLPNMSFPYVVVVTTDIGASPQAVETEVTAPVEAGLATTSDLKNIQSMSYYSYSMVILEYEQSANMDSILIEIQQSLDQVKGTFPDTVGTPIVMQIDPDMLPILVSAVSVEGVEGADLTNYIENTIKPQLESVNGVASVTTSGGIVETVQVTIDEKKVDELNKKIRKVIDKKFADAEKQLNESEEKLEAGKEELEYGQNELISQTSDAETELQNQKIALYQTEGDLKTQLTLLNATKDQINNAIEMLNNMNDNVADMQNQAKGLGEVLELYTNGTLNEEQFKEATGMTVEEAQQNMAILTEQINGITEALQERTAILIPLGVNVQTLEDIPTALDFLTESLAQIEVNIATIETALEQIEGGKITLDDAISELNKGKLLGTIKLSEASSQIAEGEAAMTKAKEEFKAEKDKAYSAVDINSVLSIETLQQLLVAQNFSMPAGYINSNDGQYLIKVGDRVKDVDELRNLVLVDLNMEGINPILLSDVANVELIDNSAEVYANINGKPGILLSFEKQTGYSTGDVTDAIQERFKSIEKSEDLNIKFSILMNQGIYIDMITKSILENMILGALLAIIILMLFLKDGRPTLIIACAIPLSVIFAVVLMYFSNITLNIISMSGLTLGIGMLVDNSIVVIENIYRLRNEGMSIKKAAVYGASQVAGAITASTLTTICVFAPIVFTDGITRQLFVDMGLTIAYTLTASLIVALTIVPAIASGVLNKEKPKKEGGFGDKVMNLYARFLRKCLKYKPVVFITMIALLVLSIFLAVSKGTAFMPEMSSTQATVIIEPVEGEKTTLAELKKESDAVVENIVKIPEVTTVGAMAGTGSSLGGIQANAGDRITMYVLIDEEKKLSNDELEEKINKAAEGAHCKVTVQTNMMDMSALSGGGIKVMIKGRDIEKMQNIARDVADIISNVEGTTEINDGLDELTNQINIKVDKSKAAKYNMTTAQIFQLVYAQIADTRATTKISTDVTDYDVFVRTGEQSEVTIDKLKQITFTYTNRETQETKEIPITDVAEFTETAELSSILRDAQNRYIQVTASIEDGYNIGLVGNEIRDRLSKYDVPEGYSVQMKGEDENINDAIKQMTKMLLLAVIFIYLVMVAQFQSLLSPFIIMFTIPLAFTGGFLALYLTNKEVSVISMIGFVMLAGIIVNNGIVLIDYIIQLRRKGMEKKEAIVESARTRMRPVLMTALTTIISMSTMALGFGQGAEMSQPMAIVVVGGLIYGTLLTLIVVPCIYDAFNKEKNMVEEEL